MDKKEPEIIKLKPGYAYGYKDINFGLTVRPWNNLGLGSRTCNMGDPEQPK